MLKYKKNDVVEVTINNLGINGEGVAKLDAPIFVPYALKGEIVSVKIVKVLQTFYFGKLEKIIKKSSSRVNAKCSIFTKCGGCQLQYLSYEEQLGFKTNLVKETLAKVGNVHFEVKPCIKSDDEYFYRNKISIPTRTIDGQKKIGYFAGRTHNVIEVDACPVAKLLLNKVVEVFKDFSQKYNISYYSDETKKGLVRHLVARQFNKSVLVAVVINGQKLPYAKELYQNLSKVLSKVTLYVNHNTIHNNVILGAKSTLIAGEPYLEEKLLGIKVNTSIESFMQVNSNIRDKIYLSALEKIKAFEPSTIIDAYSGAGLLTGILAKNLNTKVVGLEIVEKAVEASNKMLKENNLENTAKNILGDCTITLPQTVQKAKGKTTLIVDPPRKGLTKEIIKAILKSKPEQIIYIACGLTALARDLGYLLNTKNLENEKHENEASSVYEIADITPYDMFPQTKHIETLVELKIKH